MVLLKGVASRGTTVICSLHQPRPRMVDLLDRVMLLSGGEVAFFGHPAEAESYFSSVGRPFPADQRHSADGMLDLCSRADVALPSLFRRSSLAEGSLYDSNGASGRKGDSLEDVSVAASGADADNKSWLKLGGYCGARRRRAGFCVQVEALMRRLLLRAVRNPMLLLLHFLGSILMAICLGTIFRGRLSFTFEGAQSRRALGRRVLAVWTLSPTLQSSSLFVRRVVAHGGSLGDNTCHQAAVRVLRPHHEERLTHGSGDNHLLQRSACPTAI